MFSEEKRFLTRSLNNSISWPCPSMTGTSEIVRVVIWISGFLDLFEKLDDSKSQCKRMGLVTVRFLETRFSDWPFFLTAKRQNQRTAVPLDAELTVPWSPDSCTSLSFNEKRALQLMVPLAMLKRPVASLSTLGYWLAGGSLWSGAPSAVHPKPLRAARRHHPHRGRCRLRWCGECGWCGRAAGDVLARAECGNEAGPWRAKDSDWTEKKEEGKKEKNNSRIKG